MVRRQLPCLLAVLFQAEQILVIAEEHTTSNPYAHPAPHYGTMTPQPPQTPPQDQSRQYIILRHYNLPDHYSLIPYYPSTVMVRQIIKGHWRYTNWRGVGGWWIRRRVRVRMGMGRVVRRREVRLGMRGEVGV